MMNERCSSVLGMAMIVLTFLIISDSFLFHRCLKNPELQFDCIVLDSKIKRFDYYLNKIQLSVIDLEQEKVIKSNYTINGSNLNFNLLNYQVDGKIRKCARPNSIFNKIECALVPF